MIEYIGKYFGPDKIKDVREHEMNGSQMVEVLFDYGGKMNLQRDVLIACATDKVNDDLTALRENKVYVITKEILKIFLMYNLNLNEYDYLDATLRNSIDYQITLASEHLWGNPKKERDFLQLDAILKNVDLGKDDNKGAPSEGVGSNPEDKEGV